eukprot:CAMPEP_0117448232 /NCGR_PEP_ID=MMETSP0759-20121206/7292_1 /TAXON_ID=63605 /ORGANISM="Percolomonas cosmopolitus, Strain WS" /LENGTH=363 /DNA_ID=CAMNT_0005240607 /DNA_START=73 /DNA_END=1164 /DNA_ORIENTATION=-
MQSNLSSIQHQNRSAQRFKILFPNDEYRILTHKQQEGSFRSPLHFDELKKKIEALFERHMGARANRGLKVYFMDDENDWCVFDREVWDDLSAAPKLKLKVREREQDEQIDDELQTSFMNLSDENGLVLSDEDKNLIRDTCVSLRGQRTPHEMAETVANVLGRINDKVEILEWIQKNVNLEPPSQPQSSQQYQQRPYEQPPPQQQQQAYPSSGPQPYRQPPAPAWEQQAPPQHVPPPPTTQVRASWEQIPQQQQQYVPAQVHAPYPQAQHQQMQNQQPTSASSQSSRQSFGTAPQPQQQQQGSMNPAHAPQQSSQMDPTEGHMRDLLSRLSAMGFTNEEDNRKQLAQNKMDISATVQSLLRENA